MELIDYLRMLGRRWRWVVALTLVGLSSGAIYGAVAPRTYEASALLFVGNSDTSGSSGETRDDLSASRFTLERMDSYAALVDSPEVTRAVNDELQLGVDPEDIASVLSASVLSKTVVLKVTATGNEPASTASIANVAAERLGAVIQLVEAPGTGAASPLKVTVTRPANAPGTPTSPNVKLALALGLVGGLGAGLLAAALRDQAVLNRSLAPAQLVDDGLVSSAPAEHAQPSAVPAAPEDAVAADQDQAPAPEAASTKVADASEAATGEAAAPEPAPTAVAAAPAPDKARPTRRWWTPGRGHGRGASAPAQDVPDREEAAAPEQLPTDDQQAPRAQLPTDDQQAPDASDVSDRQPVDERLVMAGTAPLASHALELQPPPAGPPSSSENPVASLDHAGHQLATPGDDAQDAAAAPGAVSRTDVDEDHAPSSA